MQRMVSQCRLLESIQIILSLMKTTFLAMLPLQRAVWQYWHLGFIKTDVLPIKMSSTSIAANSEMDTLAYTHHQPTANIHEDDDPQYDQVETGGGNIHTYKTTQTKKTKKTATQTWRNLRNVTWKVTTLPQIFFFPEQCIVFQIHRMECRKCTKKCYHWKKKKSSHNTDTAELCTKPTISSW